MSYVSKMIEDDKEVSFRRVFNMWAEEVQISVMTLSVGQENKFKYTTGFSFKNIQRGRLLYESWRRNNGEFKISGRINGEFTISRRNMLRKSFVEFFRNIKSGWKVLVLFFRIKEESLAMMKFNCAIE